MTQPQMGEWKKTDITPTLILPRFSLRSRSSFGEVGPKGEERVWWLNEIPAQERREASLEHALPISGSKPVVFPFLQPPLGGDNDNPVI